MTKKNNNTPPPDDKDFGRHALTITLTADIYQHGAHVTSTSTDSGTQAVEERLRAAVLNELLRIIADTPTRHKQPQQQQPS